MKPGNLFLQGANSRQMSKKYDMLALGGITRGLFNV